MNNILENFYFIGQGCFLTLQLLSGSLMVGTLLGTIFSILFYKGWFRLGIHIYISVLRGTPVLLQLSFMYFAAPQMLGLKLSMIPCGILTFGLNSAAYITEIFRSGLSTLGKGQFEAAQSLKIPTFFMWKDLILPQVFRRILPNFINESIALLKETALIGTLGGMDIMRLAQTLGAEQFTYFMPLCIAAFYYYILVFFLEYMGKKIEKTFPVYL